jgi:hypothetical protein
LVQHEEEADPALLMVVRIPDNVIDTSTGARVFLNEERARVQFCRHDDDADAGWFLETGASNHMTTMPECSLS